MLLLLEWRIPIDCVWDLNSLVTANISSHFLKKVTDSIYMHHGIFCLGIDFEFRTKVKMTNPFNFFFIWGQKPFFHIHRLVQAGWIVIVFLQALVSLLQMNCLVDLNLSSSQEMKLHHFTELCYLSNHLPQLRARKIILSNFYHPKIKGTNVSLDFYPSICAALPSGEK